MMLCSKDRINTGRQMELDLARALAVVFMIFIHGQLFFGDTDVVDSAFGAFNDFVGMVPSAPMFMFLLGVGINYTRKQDPKMFYKRGFMLLLSGYLLNFLKGFVPCLVNAYLYADIYYVYEGINELLYVDILHFSGLAMMMFGFLKHIKAKPWFIVCSMLGIGLLNQVMLPIEIKNFWASSVLGLFWGCSHSSYFPFLTWAFYPLAGFLFGGYLIRCTNKRTFYSVVLLLSLVLFFGGTYLFNYYYEIPSGMTTDTLYYHHGLTDNLTFTGLIMLELAVLSFVVSVIPNWLNKIVARFSKNVTSIFFIHWIILTWSALFIPMNSLGMIEFIILLVVVVVLSDILASIYHRYSTRRKSSAGVVKSNG